VLAVRLRRHVLKVLLIVRATDTDREDLDACLPSLLGLQLGLAARLAGRLAVRHDDHGRRHVCAFPLTRDQHLFDGVLDGGARPRVTAVERERIDFVHHRLGAVVFVEVEAGLVFEVVVLAAVRVGGNLDHSRADVEALDDLGDLLFHGHESVRADGARRVEHEGNVDRLVDAHGGHVVNGGATVTFKLVRRGSVERGDVDVRDGIRGHVLVLPAVASPRFTQVFTRGSNVRVRVYASGLALDDGVQVVAIACPVRHGVVLLDVDVRRASVAHLDGDGLVHAVVVLAPAEHAGVVARLVCDNPVT